MSLKTCILCFAFLFCCLPVMGDDKAEKNEISVCNRPELNQPYFITLWQQDSKEYSIEIKGTKCGAVEKQFSETRLTGMVTWLRLPSPIREQTVIEIKVSTILASRNGKALPLKSMEGKAYKIVYKKDKSFVINEINNYSETKNDSTSEGEKLLADVFAPDDILPENLLGSPLSLTPKATWEPSAETFIKRLNLNGISSKEKNWTTQGLYRGITSFQGIDCHDIELSVYSMYIPCYDCKINVQYRIPASGVAFPVSIKKQILEIVDHIMPDTEQILTGTSFQYILRHRGEVILLPQDEKQ